LPIERGIHDQPESGADRAKINSARFFFFPNLAPDRRNEGRGHGIVDSIL